MMLPLHYFRFILVFVFCFASSYMQAQAPKLKFKHISIEQGLSNSTIESIYQDKRGFIWFGTRDGLNRYDGNQMTTYRFDAADTNSISDNFISYIYEDHNHALWIGTINGLNRFDPATNKFTPLQTNNGKAENPEQQFCNLYI